jgi:Flp pilus assembly protein TadG
MASLTIARLLRRSGGASERGAQLIELALVLPVLLFVLAGILDMGFLFKDYQVVTNAAREGARMAALPGWSAPQVTTRVNNYLAAGGIQGSATTTIDTVTLVTDSVSGRTINGIRVIVEVPHTYLILGPLSQLVSGASVANSVTLRAVATMRTEVAAGL